MANTFKVKSNAAMPSSSGTPDTIYTCGASGGTVILGLVLANVCLLYTSPSPRD